jgi:hypothetical protein
LIVVNIIKLCVGADSIDDLSNWQVRQSAMREGLGLDHRPVCDTRMTPKRRDDVLAGGSLYWVIKGVILVRQSIEDIVTFQDEAGRSRCELVLNSELVHTAPQRRKAFQGWRYFDSKDAPADLVINKGGEALPEALRAELIDIGAW